MGGARQKSNKRQILPPRWVESDFLDHVTGRTTQANADAAAHLRQDHLSRFTSPQEVDSDYAERFSIEFQSGFVKHDLFS